MAKTGNLVYVIFFVIFTKSTSQHSCDCRIPHGRVSWCKDSLTSYSCDEGYEETTAWLTCSSASREWVPLTPVLDDVSYGLCVLKSCPKQIPNGALSGSCSAKVGSACDYSCDTEYVKAYENIECETSTNWSRNPHTLCYHRSYQQCPYEVTDGDLDLVCKRRPGDTCTFSCQEGYMAESQNTVYCDATLHWSQSLQSVCKDIICPTTIPNGRITPRCSRRYDILCFSEDYECDPGFVKPAGPPALKCNASGQWHWSRHEGQPCYREEDMCPSKIRNGNIVWHCDRQDGSTCTFSCDPGCTQNRSKVWLNCRADGSWDVDTNRLCTDCRPISTTPDSRCPATISRGRISSTCDRKPLSRCYYTCDIGCSKRSSQLTCNIDLHWTWQSFACHCPESYTPSYSSPTGSTGSAVIGGVVGAVIFVVIVLVVILVWARNKQRHSTPSHSAAAQNYQYQSNVPGRPPVGGMATSVTSPTYGRNSQNYGITSPNYAVPSQDTYYTSLQPHQNIDSNSYSQLQPPLANNNVDTGPPAYSSVTPSDEPPSYEQVTSHPDEFKA